MNHTSSLANINSRHSKAETRSIVATLGSMNNMSKDCYSSMSGIAQGFVPVSLSATRVEI